MIQVLLSDLDGTMCCTKHRKHFVQGKKRNFDAFNLACVNDPPLPTVEIIKGLINGPIHIYFLSGRDEMVREQTLDWLIRHLSLLNSHRDWLNSRLYMRRSRDFRSDDLVKKEFLDSIHKTLDEQGNPYNIIGVFDDRNKVIRMWQENGLFVFNCNQTGEEF